MTVTIADIHAAARLVEGAMVRTPSVASPRLTELTGARVVLKLENFQHTGSFKDRGALVKLASLGPRTVKGVGAAAQDPLISDGPESPRNRRIAIVLLRGTGHTAQ